MRTLLFFTDFVDPPPAPGTGPAPDKRRFIELLPRVGLRGEYVAYFGLPWNPLARRHAVFRAIDPARAVWALMRRRRAAVILSFAESGILVPLALRPLYRSRLMVVHDSDHQGWRPRRLVQAYVLPRADLVLTQTRAQAAYLREQYQLRRPPVFIGPCIDDAFFSPRQGGGGTAGEYVLALGNDGARDFATLLEAIAPLDIPLKLLTRLPVTLPPGARGRIELIDRRVSFAELRDLYAGARLVALPMRQRISPGGMTSVLEAMAMAKPIVLSASTGVVELVDPGVTGLVVPVGDAAALRAALQDLWPDPARCAAMGAAARVRLDRDYSSERYVERLAEAIASLD